MPEDLGVRLAVVSLNTRGIPVIGTALETPARPGCQDLLCHLSEIQFDGVPS